MADEAGFLIRHFLPVLQWKHNGRVPVPRHTLAHEQASFRIRAVCAIRQRNESNLWRFCC